MARECLHTSDWWKQMIPCVCCGAMYSDEEAQQIAYENTRVFESQQLADIERMKAESEAE
jgi:hypothetical protein